MVGGEVVVGMFCCVVYTTYFINYISSSGSGAIGRGNEALRGNVILPRR